MPILVQLWWRCLIANALAFGGGFGAVTLYREMLAGWIEPPAFVGLVVVARSAPGSLAVNLAALVGHELAGWPGLLVAVGAALTPPLCLALCGAAALERWGRGQTAAAVLSGMGSAAVALVAAAGVRLTVQSVVGLRSALVFACALLLALKWRCHPALIILGAGVVGIAARAL